MSEPGVCPNCAKSVLLCPCKPVLRGNNIVIQPQSKGVPNATPQDKAPSRRQKN